MKASYCLISQPWIPCSLPDGTQREFGLAEALRRAHEITAVSDPSPPITISLHRLLLAILHRVFGPRNSREWRALWDAGRFDGDRLEAYFTQWKHRFDLFDEERPFYQVGGLDRGMLKSVATLAPECASGNNAALFDHATDGSPTALAPNFAARLILVGQNFAFGGRFSGAKAGESAEASPLVTGAAFLASGSTLARTLLLNLVICPPKGELSSPRGSDNPAWERNVSTAVEARRPDGHLDYLTWQSRRVWLEPALDQTGAARVRQSILTDGCRFPKGYFHHADPMLVYRRKERAKPDENPWPPLRFSEGRAMWRDSLAILQSIADERQRPAVMDHLAERVQEGALAPEETLDLAAFGLCSNQAKMIFWRQERQPLPLAYLARPELIEQLGHCLATTEQVASHLSKAIWLLASELLAPGERAAEKNAIRTAASATGAMPAYWSALEPPFHRLVVTLAEEHADTDAIAREWTKRACKTAHTALDEAISGLHQDARTLRAATAAQRLLMGRLHQLTTPIEEVNHAASD